MCIWDRLTSLASVSLSVVLTRSQFSLHFDEFFVSSFGDRKSRDRVRLAGQIPMIHYLILPLFSPRNAFSVGIVCFAKRWTRDISATMLGLDKVSTNHL